MNTKRYQITPNILCQNINGTSFLPALLKLNFDRRSGNSGLGEEDELFIGYGHVPSAFLYRMQDMYSRPLQ